MPGERPRSEDDGRAAPTSRRRLLAAVAAGTATLAGCLGGRSDGEADGATPTTTAEDLGENVSSVVRYGTPSTVCQEEIRSDPGIYAVTDPAFGPDWSDVSAERYEPLADDETVVGVVRDGVARAYPLSILTYHEVVNDDLGGPLLVTYCPLCRSGLVAKRLVEGAPTTFHVSGLLFRPERVQSAAATESDTVFGAGVFDPEAEVRNSGNLVMYDDRTRSYWSQILARAICGPRVDETLTPVPAATTTWDTWRAQNPDTEVLLPPPYSGTDRPGD